MKNSTVFMIVKNSQETSSALKEKIGDYLLDVSKLVFAGVVLSSILSFEGIPKLIILLLGTIATVAIAM
ncbi:MAG: DUF6722 family protein, partial [Candidatus Margulisiibacteriota bacterium]